MSLPFCSLIVVQYNRLDRLQACIDALRCLDWPREHLELIVVDNGSNDGSVAWLEQQPDVRLVINDRNSYARALNLGVAASRGELVGFVNNDAVVAPDWLRLLSAELASYPRAAAAGGKLLLEDGRINSVGHKRLPDHFVTDEGLGELDRGQHDTAREVMGLCWASTLFRRPALEAVGPVDESFVMYFEDVDYAERCRAAGYTLRYVPRARTRHVMQGSSGTSHFPAWMCNRNRLLFVAKHYPGDLACAVETSHFAVGDEPRDLAQTLLPTLQALLAHQAEGALSGVLPAVCAAYERHLGPEPVDAALARLQVVRGHRRMAVGIYDHALQHIGGGQKYAATMAALLQDRFDVTIIASKPVTLAQVEAWYQLDLGRCRLEIIPLGFYESRGLEHIDSGRVTVDTPNPFDAIAEASARFDIFVNANMLDKVEARAPLSVFVGHFPERPPGAYFHLDSYTFAITSSQYGARWLRKRWGRSDAIVVYPAVETPAPAPSTGLLPSSGRLDQDDRTPAPAPSARFDIRSGRLDQDDRTLAPAPSTDLGVAAAPPKEPIILSMARFEPGGTKRQLEMIDVYNSLWQRHPHDMRGWKLVLVGGSMAGFDYLPRVQQAARECLGPVEVHTNVSYDELCRWYQRADIFWHACGLEAHDPHHVEHFGMTTVEAMQHACVPVVIDGGGQQEIVEHEVSGLRFATRDELRLATLRLLRDPELRERLRAAAHVSSQRFRLQAFAEQVEHLFGLMEREYREPAPLRLEDVVARLRSRPLGPSLPLVRPAAAAHATRA